MDTTAELDQAVPTDAIQLSVADQRVDEAWEKAQRCPTCAEAVADHPTVAGARCVHPRDDAGRAAFAAAFADRDGDALRLLLTILADDTTAAAAAAGVDSLFQRGHDLVTDAAIVDAVCAEIRMVVRERLSARTT